VRFALNATHAIGGKIEKQGDRILLHSWITDARSGVRIKQWTADYAPNQIQYAGVAIAGLASVTFHLRPLLSTITVSEVGKQNYLAGMSALRSDSGVNHALALMEVAVESDRNSALFQAGLAEAQWFKYFVTKDRRWLDRSAESQRQAERLNTDLAPGHRVTGLLLAGMGLYENSIAEYLRAIELEPNNAENLRRLGQVYEQNNQLAEALTAFQKGLTLDPTYYRGAQELGAFYYNRADYVSAVAPLARAALLAPGEPSVRFGLALCYLNLGRYSDAENELRSALQLKETTTTLHALGLSLMYQRREREAIPFLERAVEAEPDRYLSWMYLGTSYRRTGQNAEAKAAYRRGLEVAERDLVRNPRSGYIRSFLGYFNSELGDRRRAQSEIAQALGFSPNDAETRWTALLTYEALGDRNSTLALAAVAPQQQLADLSRWPDVAGLRNDSRFLQMLATYQLK
jgi:tetratricopeptide (TPR) repeat protein